MKFSHTLVKTLDAYKHPGEPTRFEVKEKGLDVEQILEHWSEAYTDASFFPSEYYRVTASDGKTYLLRYSTLFKSWWVREYPGDSM
jgi:hypothetical protein